jgi:hypothetical protein
LGNGYLQSVTGVENLANKTGKAFKAIGKSIADATSGGAQLAALEKQFETQNRNSQKLQLQYQFQAEKLRQLRDDESLTIAQRMKANTDLGALLKKQIASGVDLSSLKVRRGRPRKNKLIDLSKAGSPLNTPDPKMPNFTPKHDLVNHPAHYTDGGIEVIDFIDEKRLGYHLGNVVKYI